MLMLTKIEQFSNYSCSYQLLKEIFQNSIGLQNTKVI
jgi:hypothetical protein